MGGGEKGEGGGEEGGGRGMEGKEGKYRRALVVPGVISVSAPTIWCRRAAPARQSPSPEAATAQHESAWMALSNKTSRKSTALDFRRARCAARNSDHEPQLQRGSMAQSPAGSSASLAPKYENTATLLSISVMTISTPAFLLRSKPTLGANVRDSPPVAPSIHNKLFVFGSYQRTDIRQTHFCNRAPPTGLLERPVTLPPRPRSPTTL